MISALKWQVGRWLFSLLVPTSVAVNILSAAIFFLLGLFLLLLI